MDLKEEEVGLEEHKIKRTKTENQRHLYECVTLPFTELDNVKIQPSCQVILFLEIGKIHCPYFFELITSSKSK